MSERDLLALVREMTNEDAAIIMTIGSMALLETSSITEESRRLKLRRLLGLMQRVQQQR
jgi:hypothetical protein